MNESHTTIGREDVCPKCNGDGDFEHPIDLGHGRIGYRYERCPECDGAGTLTHLIPLRDALRDGF